MSGYKKPPNIGTKNVAYKKRISRKSIRAFPAAQGRALAAEFILSEAEGPEGRARDTSGPPGPTGFDLP